MNPATKELHETVIRLLKGVLTAREKWLSNRNSLHLVRAIPACRATRFKPLACCAS